MLVPGVMGCSILSENISTGYSYIDREPAWSPDGQWIVYTESSETGKIWQMSPGGSEKPPNHILDREKINKQAIIQTKEENLKKNKKNR